MTLRDLCWVWFFLSFTPILFLKLYLLIFSHTTASQATINCTNLATFLNFLILFTQLSVVFLMWRLGWQTVNCSWITIKQKWFWLLQRRFSVLTLFSSPSVGMAVTSNFRTVRNLGVPLLIQLSVSINKSPLSVEHAVGSFQTANLLCLSNMLSGAFKQQISSVCRICCLELSLSVEYANWSFAESV